MNLSEFFRKLSEYPVTEELDVIMELPSLCGNSDAGKRSSKNPGCRQHGHLSLAVATQTFYDAMKEDRRLILINLPQKIIDDILDNKQPSP